MFYVVGEQEEAAEGFFGLLLVQKTQNEACISSVRLAALAFRMRSELTGRPALSAVI